MKRARLKARNPDGILDPSDTRTMRTMWHFLHTSEEKETRELYLSEAVLACTIIIDRRIKSIRDPRTKLQQRKI